MPCVECEGFGGAHEAGCPLLGKRVLGMSTMSTGEVEFGDLAHAPINVHPDLEDIAGGFYGDVAKPVPGAPKWCAHCGERPATERWGDALALTHGGAQLWCKVCVLEAQIAHAEERAAALPELRKQLELVKNQTE